MKKVYLMKGMAAMALGLVVASCNKTDVFNPYAEQEAKQQEFTANFQESVMGDKTIDPNQTWSTAVNATVKVSVNLDYNEDYTVYVFGSDPNYNPSAAYLGTAQIKSGSSSSITIAKPADLDALYIACVNKKGNFFVQRFVMEGTSASVNVGGTANQNAVARRATSTINSVSVDPDSYKRSKNEFISDLKSYNDNWSGYYDLTNYTNQSLSNAQYSGGDGVHFIIPTGQTFSLTSTHFQGSWDATVIVVKGTLNLTKANLGDSFTWNGDGGITNQYANLGNITHGRTIVIDGGIVNIDVPTFTISNKSNIINLGGTLNLNGTTMDYANGANLGFCNFGQINGSNGAGINFAGGTPYYNGGNIDFSATNCFIKFNGTQTFVNAGHIHADNADASATEITNSELARGGQNAKVINLCDMTFTKFFSCHTYIGTANSLLYAGGGLYTNMGGSITLGSQAMIKIGQWYDNGVTCYASSNASDYAVMKITGKMNEQNGSTVGETQGYFYFDIDQSKIYGKDTQSGEGLSHINAVKKNMLKLTVSEATAPANITIASDEDGCNYIGYHEGDGDHSFTPNYIYFAFEDLGTTDDFDFNDVVIRVSTPVEGISTVELCAAGGTMPTYVLYDGAILGNGEEVHAKFGVSTSTMVNTLGAEGSTTDDEFKTLGTITVAGTADLTTLPFSISVNNNNGQSTLVSVGNFNGKAPLYITASGDENGRWFWPTGRTNIADAFETFADWAADATSNTDWYKNATSGKVFVWE